MYLRPDAVPEPLIDRWCAWVQLISPVTAALNVTKRHIPIMESFLVSPALHMAAAKNPELQGGPFIHYGPGQVGEIRSLVEETKTHRPKLLELSEAIDELRRMLEQRADGTTLDPLYEYVPEVLRGYVELEYDLYEQPRFRLIEGLLYKSPYYQENAQSVHLSITEQDARPFMLSSPRLPCDDDILIHRPFKDPAYDLLFQARTQPVDVESVADALGVVDHQAFRTLFTEQSPHRHVPPPPNKTRIRYMGHACLLIERGDVSVLIDPILAYDTGGEPARYSIDELPEKIDYAMISHHHQDHVQIESLLQLRGRIGEMIVGTGLSGTVQDPSLKLMLQAIGFPRVRELDELETVGIGDVQITALPFIGEHHDLAIRSRLGYRIDAGDVSVTALVDSCNVSPEIYDRVFAATGPTDLLFLGMECVGSPLTWSYGALLPNKPRREHDQSRRGRASTCDEGMRLVKSLQPSEVYVYALGQEPWLQHILGLSYSEDAEQLAQSNALVEACGEQNITSKRLIGRAELIR